MMSALECSEIRSTLIECGPGRREHAAQDEAVGVIGPRRVCGLNTQGRVLRSRRRALAEEHGHSLPCQEGVRVGYHI